MLTLKDKVISTVKSIPKGTVVSYGQVASLAGSPRAARQVGYILRQADPSSLPWWRVVNSHGYLSIKHNFEATKALQKKLLQEEGVVVSEKYTVDLGVSSWEKSHLK
jgi:methylated-DNA-protein-cysteine methyltransferase-like protein